MLYSYAMECYSTVQRKNDTYYSIDESRKHTKGASDEITCIVKFHLYESSKINKFVETASKLVVGCGVGLGEIWEWHITGWGHFVVGIVMKMF